MGEAEGEVAGVQAFGVKRVEGANFPEGFGEETKFFGFVNGAGALVAAGAVAEVGDVFGWGMAVGPRSVLLVVGDVFAHAGDGVAVDALF